MRLTCQPPDYKIICADLLSRRARSDAGTDPANNYVISDRKNKDILFFLKIIRSKNPQLNLESPRFQKRICPLTNRAGQVLSEHSWGVGVDIHYLWCRRGEERIIRLLQV